MCFRTRAQAWNLGSTLMHSTWVPRALIPVIRHRRPQEVPTNPRTQPCQNPPVSASPWMGSGMSPSDQRDSPTEGPGPKWNQGSLCLTEVAVQFILPFLSQTSRLLITSPHSGIHSLPSKDIEWVVHRSDPLTAFSNSGEASDQAAHWTKQPK